MSGRSVGSFYEISFFSHENKLFIERIISIAITPFAIIIIIIVVAAAAAVVVHCLRCLANVLEHDQHRCLYYTRV